MKLKIIDIKKTPSNRGGNNPPIYKYVLEWNGIYHMRADEFWQDIGKNDGMN